MNLNGNIGTTKAAGIISIASDGPAGTAGAGNANLSYGTQTYDTGTNTATFLQLEAQTGGFLGAIIPAPSVDGTTTFAFKGGGTLAVGQDFAGDHQNVLDINASGTTGSVFITGATSGVATQAFATTANPGWLFGSAAGFLDDTGTGGVFALKSFELGSGKNTLDVSSASIAQVAALTTTPGTLVALNNEIIVSDAVATTGSATTFANIKGFEILGVAGAAGTINDANLPTSINEIIYQTAAVGAVTITNQVNPLEVNTEDNGKGFALTSTGTGFTDSFTLDIGNPLHNTAGFGSLSLSLSLSPTHPHKCESVYQPVQLHARHTHTAYAHYDRTLLSAFSLSLSHTLFHSLFTYAMRESERKGGANVMYSKIGCPAFISLLCRAGLRSFFLYFFFVFCFLLLNFYISPSL